MKYPLKFAVIGGDLRQAKLAELLVSDGHTVFAAALDKAELSAGVFEKTALRAAVSPADCVILPLPVTGRPGYLNTPLTSDDHTIKSLFSLLSPAQTVCAGRMDDESRGAALERGIEVFDYFAREELAIRNAACTAEGALEIAMANTASTLWGSKVLVVGFGRIGKLLSHRLRALGARVSVSARSCADMAWITAYGCEALDTRRLSGKLGDFAVVFNTVPAPVLGGELLRELRDGCLCIDLASKPGGVDFSAAAHLGIRAIWALSLPGEAAPVTAAEAIRDTIYNILCEKDDKLG